MVKPQIITEKKDDLKKPDNVLVKVVTVAEEPAPINLEPNYGYVETRQRRGRRMCLCLSLLLTSVLLLCGTSMIFFKYHHRDSYFCGVVYMDGWDSNYDYSDYNEGNYGSSYQGIPYGNDALMAPRPTGPPMDRFLQEGVDIQMDLNIVRITNPGDGISQDVTVLHDFDMNLSVYRFDSSQMCYIRPLNMDSSLEPEYFMNLIQNDEYQQQQFPMMSEVYGVIPDEVYNLDEISEHVQSLCEGYSTYYIQTIPTDQWHEFWRVIKSVIREHRRGDDDDDSGEKRGDGGDRVDSDGDSSSDGDHSGRHHSGGVSSSEEGRRHGGGRRHHGGSSSSDGSRMRQGGIRLIREFMNNVRSFDGQQVVDMHIFQTQKLGDLSQLDTEQLDNFLKPGQ